MLLLRKQTTAASIGSAVFRVYVLDVPQKCLSVLVMIMIVSILTTLLRFVLKVTITLSW